jgi:hypothetical protein
MEPGDFVETISSGDVAQVYVNCLPLFLDQGCSLKVIRNPRQLCEFFLEELRKQGVQIRTGVTPTCLVQDENGKLSGVQIKTISGMETSKTYQ